MCVVAIAWHAHPRWALIVAGNRDELHVRSAAPLARWATPDHVLAGRDLQAGGTWMGLSTQGRFAVVTNLRGYGAAEPDRASRGALVTDLLSGEGSYANLSCVEPMRFNPFNLIMVDRGQAHFLSNRPEVIRTPIAHGIYGLSNGALDEPWPKTMQLKARVLDWMMVDATHPEALLESLALSDLPDVGLKPTAPSDIAQEALTSPIFILDPVYGTRCSTVVAIDYQGDGVIIERCFMADGQVVGETRLPLSWP